ncbi:hypothetical protein [Aequorivita sp. CIP111184]|uniref:hypothetical protein n=1 Tax=Aequorivita sp. CIP111184 TaxID=2211356 RepID=UPI000DBBB659|nr:hypothetical protein [Aequorivita sp. CIP111184]SRX55738.1 hypothetical protein AEQU1_02763 [Aequorivita sp. CIP111184]
MILPWAKLIPTAISIVEMAGSVLSSNQKAKARLAKINDFDPESLSKRIEVLESNELKQAELIQQMAQQNLTLIKKAENNYKLAILGFIIALISIVLFFILFFLKL